MAEDYDLILPGDGYDVLIPNYQTVPIPWLRRIAKGEADDGTTIMAFVTEQPRATPTGPVAEAAFAVRLTPADVRQLARNLADWAKRFPET